MPSFAALRRGTPRDAQDWATFITEVSATLDRIGRVPESYPAWPRTRAAGPFIRKATIQQFPYVIAFEKHEEHQDAAMTPPLEKPQPQPSFHDIGNNRQAHHRVMFPHLDRLESACVVHGPRAPEMACVAFFGCIVRISLDPRRTARGGVRNHAIEQCGGDPVPSERRGYDEARDSDHGWRLGSVGIDKAVEAVVGAQ